MQSHTRTRHAAPRAHPLPRPGGKEMRRWDSKGGAQARMGGFSCAPRCPASLTFRDSPALLRQESDGYPVRPAFLVVRFLFVKLLEFLCRHLMYIPYSLGSPAWIHELLKREPRHDSAPHPFLPSHTQERAELGAQLACGQYQLSMHVCDHSPQRVLELPRTRTESGHAFVPQQLPTSAGPPPPPSWQRPPLPSQRQWPRASSTPPRAPSRPP